MPELRLPATRCRFDDDGVLWISMTDLLDLVGTMKAHSKEIFDTDYYSGFKAVEQMLTDLKEKSETRHGEQAK